VKKAFVCIAAAVWVVLGSVGVSRWWYAHPDFFPALPDAWWQLLDHLVSASTLDEKANVEFFVVVFFSFLVVLSLTAFTLAVIWRIRKNLSR
jgi:hypothetical protein